MRLETNDLNWKQYVENITKSANKALGFLRRNFIFIRINAVKAKEQAYYLTYVRPILVHSVGSVLYTNSGKMMREVKYDVE